MDWALSILQKREPLDVLTKDGKLIRDDFMGSNVPGGKIGNGLLVIQESKTPQENSRKTKGIILVRADDVECLNLRCSTASLTDGENLPHLFIITCQGPECDDPSVIVDVIKQSSKIAIR